MLIPLLLVAACAYFAGYWHGRNDEHKEFEREWEPRLQYIEAFVAERDKADADT